MTATRPPLARSDRSRDPATVSFGDVRVVPLDEWDTLVTRLGAVDTYLSAAYHVASALLEPPGTLPVLLHVRAGSGELALPLLLRPLDGAGWDATSAYGYGGPVAGGEPDVVAFGTALDAWARHNSVVATFLRLHPLLDNRELVGPTASLVEVGPTIAWDISPGVDLVRGMHRNHKKAVRKADRLGLEISVTVRPPDLDGFRELYAATMRRQHADRFFDFPDAYWDALLTHADVLTPVLVEGRLRGRLVAGLLCLATSPWLHAHLAGWDDEARSMGASNRCYLAAARWGQEQGHSGFHLGGGVGGTESTLYEFKRRFDPAAEPRTFCVAKLVHEPDRYRALTGSDSTSGFFPPWRRAD